jgi:hypothetical protein
MHRLRRLFEKIVALFTNDRDEKDLEKRYKHILHRLKMSLYVGV